MAIPDDQDLRDFDGTVRLFPLPKVVLFPYNILPLHIFEPRYRQMTEDALSGNKLIAIVQVRSPIEWLPSGEPALEEVACLGRILQHERLPDGRFNFLLLGRKRVRLIREIESDKLYRIAQVQILDETPTATTDDRQRIELNGIFRSLIQQAGSPDPDLSAMLDSDPSLDVLTDIVAHALGLPPAIKQAFLADPHAESRAQGLLAILRQVASASTPPQGTPGRSFPPDFSPN